MFCAGRAALTPNCSRLLQAILARILNGFCGEENIACCCGPPTRDVEVLSRAASSGRGFGGSAAPLC